MLGSAGISLLCCIPHPLPRYVVERHQFEDRDFIFTNPPSSLTNWDDRTVERINPLRRLRCFPTVVQQANDGINGQPCLVLANLHSSWCKQTGVVIGPRPVTICTVETKPLCHGEHKAQLRWRRVRLFGTRVTRADNRSLHGKVAAMCIPHIVGLATAIGVGDADAPPLATHIEVMCLSIINF